MNTANVATITSVIHAPIDRVWKALVDPQEATRYMMGARMSTDWTEGGPITWTGERKGKPFHATGRVLIVREPDLLRYTHISGDTHEEHVITIELKEVAGITHLRLTQDNNTSAEARERSEAAWTVMVDKLKILLGEAPVPAPVQLRG